jgi:pimeloyl-ACP methyl ester carboxylesterase
VSFFTCPDLAACRDRLLRAVEQAFPGEDLTWTTEVDVVAQSMGGLVARYAALPPPDGQGRRLRIARLFTISTPHRGARLACLPTLHPLHRSMRPDSPIVAALQAALPQARYELYPYVGYHDLIVGREHAAPQGQTAWWVDTGPPGLAHLGAMLDPRIQADIARRLRGEPPFTRTRSVPP